MTVSLACCGIAVRCGSTAAAAATAAVTSSVLRKPMPDSSARRRMLGISSSGRIAALVAVTATFSGDHPNTPAQHQYR